MYANHILQNLSENLPVALKDTLSTDLLQAFEFTFHSANLQQLKKVETALRTILGHLIKALESNDCNILKTMTAFDFIRQNCYQNHHFNDMLHEIGLQNTSYEHLQHLTALPLSATYSCLELFLHWVDEGYCDYSALSFSFKVHLEPQDQLTIQQMRKRWHGTPAQLMKELQQLVHILKESEQDISRLDEKDVS